MDPRCSEDDKWKVGNYCRYSVMLGLLPFTQQQAMFPLAPNRQIRFNSQEETAPTLARFKLGHLNDDCDAQHQTHTPSSL